MPDIHISVKNRVATVCGYDVFAICDNTDYSVVFIFDSEWDSQSTKTARFVYGNGYTDVVLTGNACQMPQIQNELYVKIGVFAGNLKTTTPATLPLKASIRSAGGSPVEPSPSVYDQIMNLLEETMDSVDEDAERAALAAASAAADADRAEAAVEAIHDIEEEVARAEAAAQTAVVKAGEASGSASSASASATAAESAKTVAQTAAGSASASATAAQTAVTSAQQAASAADESADAAETAKTTAQSAAGSASSSATAAESAKASAQTAATNAASSATSAQSAATSAGQSATAAAGSATTAENAKTAAQTAATNASTAATAAKTAKGAAQTAATNAGQSATAAANSATAAGASADSAADSAEQAAEILEQFTSPTASATTLAPESSATATYNDGHFTFGIPKGGDGTDGVGISGIAYVRTDAQGGNVYRITLTNGNTYEFTAPKGAAGAGSGDMIAEDYDPSGVVRNAGGIVEYVDGQMPAEVTEQTVAGWGFTKNTGTYSKPSTGIPASDLASAVQSSLDKADNAVQPETGKGLFSGNYNDLTNKPTIPTIPTVTTSDNGKFLRVVNGSWAAATVPVMEGGSY